MVSLVHPDREQVWLAVDGPEPDKSNPTDDRPADSGPVQRHHLDDPNN